MTHNSQDSMTVFAELFRDAWEAAAGDDFASRMARRSLVASIADEPVLLNAVKHIIRGGHSRLFRSASEGDKQ